MEANIQFFFIIIIKTHKLGLILVLLMVLGKGKLPSDNYVLFKLQKIWLIFISIFTYLSFSVISETLSMD